MNPNDPRDFAVDPDTGELLFDETGDIVFVSGVAAVRQELDSNLSLVRGEWFLDASAGIPLFEDVLKKAPSLATVEAAYRAAIMATEGVRSILSFSLKLDRRLRRLLITFSVDTDAGPINDISRKVRAADFVLDDVPFDAPLYD